MFLTPLMIVVMLVGVLGMFGDAKAEVAYYLVPLYNSGAVHDRHLLVRFPAPQRGSLRDRQPSRTPAVGVLALQRMFDSERLMFAR